MPLTEDLGVIVPFERFTKVRISQLRLILIAIKEYDREIAKQFSVHSDYKIFDSLPGAGPVFGPRLLTAFGANRDRFHILMR